MIKNLSSKKLKILIILFIFKQAGSLIKQKVYSSTKKGKIMIYNSIFYNKFDNFNFKTLSIISYLNRCAYFVFSFF